MNRFTPFRDLEHLMNQSLRAPATEDAQPRKIHIPHRTGRSRRAAER